MSLKKRLFDAYDIEFPISGGFGTSPEHAILLKKNGPRDFVGTEYILIDYITKLQGVTWKRVAQKLFTHNDRYIDQITIETVKTTEDGVVTQ